MATFTTSVQAGSDDAQETSGVVSLTGTSLNANAAAQLSGMRFSGVTVPQGSAITAATLTLFLVSGSYDDPDVTISGEATDDAAAFTTADNDLSGRSKTAATVSWSASNVGTGNVPTPDLSAVIQPIVNRPGWASGNALALFIQGNSSSSALRWGAIDGSNPAAVLSITYTPPAGGVVAQAMHYRRLMG